MESGKVLSKRQLRRESGGIETPRTVYFLSWIGKLLLQLLIFTIIYAIFVEMIRDEYQNFFIEFLFVSLWLIIADLSAWLIIFLFRIYFTGKMGYLLRIKKEKVNYSRKAIEYASYIGIRSFCYVIGLALILMLWCSSIMPRFWAYLFVWFGIFLTAKILATLISIWITKTVY